MNANADLLATVLRALEADAREQEAYLEDRGDRELIDPAQEFAEEWAEAFDDVNFLTPIPENLVALIADVERGLLDPRLGESLDSLHEDERWTALRTSASRALRAMRAAGLIADMIPYRLYPVRFARVLEPLIGPNSEWPAIVLTQSEFDSFESAWEDALPSKTPASQVTLQRIQKAARQVYRAYPDVLEALGL